MTHCIIVNDNAAQSNTCIEAIPHDGGHYPAWNITTTHDYNVPGAPYSELIPPPLGLSADPSELSIADIFDQLGSNGYNPIALTDEQLMFLTDEVRCVRSLRSDLKNRYNHLVDPKPVKKTRKRTRYNAHKSRTINHAARVVAA